MKERQADSEGREGSELGAGLVIDERYRLEELLGRGSMGTVYRAEQLAVGRDVALKLLRSELGADPRIRAQFEKEARAVAKLRDPNCITLFDHGYDEDVDVLYMVFNYVDGVSLERFLGHAVPLHGALSVVLQVASALDHAHANGVLHRDLKPANIMVEVTDRGDRARVLDFGLAQIFGEVDIAASGGIFGSPAYMSPEQCRGDADITEASDIYALGCIAFELIEGRLPFEGQDPLTVIHAHKHHEPPPIKSPGVPFDVVDLVGRMLSKVPDERPTAEEVVAALVEHAHVDVSLSFSLGRRDRERTRETVDLGYDEVHDPATVEFDPGTAYDLADESDPESSEFALDFAPPRLVDVLTGGHEERSEAGLAETTHLGLIPSDEVVVDEDGEDPSQDTKTSLEEESDPDTVELSAAVLDDLELGGLDQLSDLDEQSEDPEVQQQLRAEAATIEFQEEKHAPTHEVEEPRRPSAVFVAIALLATGLLVLFIVWKPSQPAVIERTIVETKTVSTTANVVPPPAPFVVDLAEDRVALAVRSAQSETATVVARARRPTATRSTRPSKSSEREPKKAKRRRPKKLEFRY